MAGIFISYRRDDTAGVAGRLFDHLATKYSRDELFIDVDTVRAGVDFSNQLDQNVAQCHVLLAVIGPRWLDAKDKDGRRRLESDQDYVRKEVAAALTRDIAVIPVLVDGTGMPSEESLSGDLKPLARRQALELRHTRFLADAEAIVRAVEAVVPRRRRLWPFVAAMGVAVLVIAVFAIAWPMLKTKPVAEPPARSVMINTNLLGSDYRRFELGSDSAVCQTACAADPRCRSWSYVRAGPQGPNARCWLKHAIPNASADFCCTSGIEREVAAAPASGSGVMISINLYGSDYAGFELGPDSAALCQNTCKDDAQCRSWSYVQPGAQGPNAHCWLKNAVPTATPDSCCVSGVERPSSK